MFLWVWLDIAVTVTHTFLLMIPQCLWGNKCNCRTLCWGQCIENASTDERGRVTFHNFCFYTSHAFSSRWQQWLQLLSVCHHVILRISPSFCKCLFSLKDHSLALPVLEVFCVKTYGTWTAPSLGLYEAQLTHFNTFAALVHLLTLWQFYLL